MVTVTPAAIAVKAHTCSASPPSLPQPKAISVNGVPIDRAAIARETQNHPAERPIDAWMAAAKALVVRELLLQEARARGIAAKATTDAEGRHETDEEAQMRSLVETDVVTPNAGEDECRRYYEHNRARFRSPTIFEVRHILIATASRERSKREAIRSEAQSIIAALAEAPGRFADLAAARSACPSARAGGNLGQISRGQTVPEFEAALEQIGEPGLLPHPIETRYGFHIVWVDRRIDGHSLPFEVVRERIAGWLDERVRRTALRQYIAGLAELAEITGISLEDAPAS